MKKLILLSGVFFWGALQATFGNISFFVQNHLSENDNLEVQVRGLVQGRDDFSPHATKKGIISVPGISKSRPDGGRVEVAKLSVGFGGSEDLKIHLAVPTLKDSAMMTFLISSPVQSMGLYISMLVPGDAAPRDIFKFISKKPQIISYKNMKITVQGWIEWGFPVVNIKVEPLKK